MIKAGEINQYGEAGESKPNELTQTDLCNDGVMKTTENKQSDISEDDGVIKANELCLSGTSVSEGINADKINQADQVIKGRELTESYSCDDGGVFKVIFCFY